jgi:hypothetical protein
VPLQITLLVCVERDHFPAAVQQELLETFSASVLWEGGCGFFHPDNFTFGQPLYLSRLVATAMRVPGVHTVEVKEFQRWGELPRGEITEGLIRTGRLEILRVDNDPNAPENGRIRFVIEGGR